MMGFELRYDSFIDFLRSDAAVPQCNSGSKLCGSKCVPQEDKCKVEGQANTSGKRKMSKGERGAHAVNAFAAVSNIEHTLKDKSLSGREKAVGVAKKAALHAAIAVAANRLSKTLEERGKKEKEALPPARGNPTKSANAA